MESSLKTVAEKVIQRALRNGATAADVLIREDDNFSAAVRMGEIETLKQAISTTMLLRVFTGKRTATSNTSDLSPSVVEQLVDETIEMAKLTSEDESAGLPDASLFDTDFPDLNLADQAWETLSPRERIDMALRTEQAALKADPRIINSEGASFDYSRAHTVLANTSGFFGEYHETGASLSVAPVAQSGGGMQRDYWVSVARHVNKLELPEAIGLKAAERALRRIGARKVSTRECPVIFDPLTARSLLGHLFQAVSGDAIYRRTSFLVNEIGNKVAADLVTVVDDGRFEGGLGSSPFDDEGVRTQTTPIIDNGVLRNYLHSAYSARKLGAKPTGNGTRAASGAVTIGPTNFCLKEGAHTPGEIISSVDSGLYVVELIGFGVNVVTGDYSRGVTGMWIENGKLAYPVQEITIAGNLRQMFTSIEMIGNDLTFLGPIASPTVKIGKMVVSGD
jgi:PmbA protein